MKVPISGQITGEPEARNLEAVAATQHFGGGIWARTFERDFADYMGQRFCVTCNSGSSANLLALAALELPRGSRVLTCAVNFPTTVNAIIQLGHIPVFVDADPETLNIAQQWVGVDAAIIAHTLGNPVDISIPPLDCAFPIIEDCCDAIGSKIDGRMVGHKGVMATASFYPAHHITMGEGGAVMTDDPRLNKIIRSYRDWGRDCWCEPGQDNTCGKRYDGDYDHKYTYSRIGWNLKITEFQAAVGVAQMERLEGFVKRRQENFVYLRAGLGDLPLEFINQHPNSKPSWFGFPFLTPARDKLARFLDDNGIGNRPIMGGNLLRQPAYKDIECEIIGDLEGADKIHEQGLWIGCYPGITVEMMDYVIQKMHLFF